MKHLFKVAFSLLFVALLIGPAKSQSTLVIDPSFGFNGFSRIDFSGNSNSDVPAQLIVTDDALVVGGATIVENFDYRTAVAKYNSAGKIDLAFGGGTGKTLAKFNARSEGLGFAVQTDGKIVGVGRDNESNAGSGQKPFIFRLNADGSVDLTFADSGYVRSRYDPISGGAHFGVVQQRDGKLVAFGHSYGNINGGSAGFGAMRFNQDGTLDVTYSGDGMTRITAQVDAQPGSGLLQADGKVLIAGATWNGAANVITLVRFDSSGNPDGTFGDQGIAASAIPCKDGQVTCHISGGKIVVSYTTVAPESFGVVRFNMDGSQDLAFAQSILTGSFSSGKAYSSAIDVNGDIYVAGQAGSDAAIAKFNATGGVAANFGTNGFLPFSLSLGNTNNFTSIAMQGNDILALGNDFGSRGGDFILTRLTAQSEAVKRFTNETSATVSPNPSSDHLIIGIDPAMHGPSTVEVYDMTARKVKHLDFVANGQDVQLNVKDLLPGTYNVQVSSAALRSVVKLTILK